MRTRTYYNNLFLICALLVVGFAITVHSVKAIDQVKAFWNNGYGYGKTWGVWQEGNYYATYSDPGSGDPGQGPNWYLFGIKGKGWLYGQGNWYKNHEEYRECWTCNITPHTYGHMLISEWEGVSTGRHYGIRYYGASQKNVYTSEDDDWDSSTCFSNVNNC